MALNIRNTERNEKYIANQCNTSVAYGEKPKDYFYFKYKVAGLDHGILLILENATMIRLFLDQRFERIKQNYIGIGPQHTFKNLPAQILEIRHKLTAINEQYDMLHDDIEKIRTINKIWEIDEVAANIDKSLMNDKDFEGLTERLAELKDSINLGYTILNNDLITVLTALGLFIAIFQMVVSLAPLIHL